jgi:hypothetical protein
MLVDAKSISIFRKSSNEIKKQFPILAKGHNVTYEFVNAVEHTKVAKNVIKDHVSENRGAREDVAKSKKIQLDSAPFVQNEEHNVVD